MSDIFFHEGDCSKAELIPKGMADIIFCDPPQCYGENAFEHTPISFTQNWIKNAIKYLRSEGLLICFSSPFHTYHYHRELTRYLKFREELVWHYNFGPMLKKQFTCEHTNIQLFQYEGYWMKYDWRKVAIPSWRNENQISRGDARGKNPGSVWSIPRLVGNAKERLVHNAAQLPERLVTRLLAGFVWPGALILDMFCGTGTVAAVAKKFNCKYHGWDCDPYMIKVSRKRLGFIPEER